MKFYTSILTIVLIFVVISLQSCDNISGNYLDREENNEVTSEQVFTRYNQVNQLVNDLYSNARYANRPLVYFWDFASASATDAQNASTVGNNATNRMNTGDYGLHGTPLASYANWEGLYESIRKANVILEGVEQYNTPDNPLSEGDLEKRLGEVYFLRAYLHFLLVRNYGEAVYMSRTVNPQSDISFERESVHAIVDKISADADSAFARIPGRWTGNDFGRVDKGAALGLKAIARWMAATPLWNGGNLENDTRVHSDEYTYDQQRWVAARDAAKEVLDFTVDGNKRYSLYRGHSENEFTNDQGNNTNNSKVYTRLWNMFYDIEAFKQEAIFVGIENKNQAWQGDQYPPSLGGSARQQPTQEQVDQYGYIAPDGYGYPVYSNRAESDGYNDANPYEGVKRDPRFYRDIIYHGATFQNTVINTGNGPDQIRASNSTTTGYFLRKFIKEGWNRNYSFPIRTPPVWRLPQIMYIYAEAVNEISGPTQEIYDMINDVRDRSFMAPMPPEVLNNKELMSDYIRRERRVELFHENHRFWTLRLQMQPTSQEELAKEDEWRSSGSTNNERAQNYWPYPQTQHFINGMRPVEDPDGPITIGGTHYRMERFFVEDRVFNSPRSYLFPLMSSELQRTPSLTQNPGW